MNYNLKKFNRKLQKVLRYQKFNLNLIELEIKKLRVNFHRYRRNRVGQRMSVTRPHNKKKIVVTHQNLVAYDRKTVNKSVIFHMRPNVLRAHQQITLE